MKTLTAHITDYDMKRLKGFLQKPQNWPQEDAELLSKLDSKLNEASVIPQKEAPSYLVTMNCHVRVADLGSKKDMKFWLAYPYEAMSGNDKISVASDIGMAILGLKVGDKVEVIGKNKKTQLRIAQIYYQPEDNKHYKL